MADLEVIPKYSPNDLNQPVWESIPRKDRAVITFRVGSATNCLDATSYGVIFTAPVPYLVRRVDEVHETAGTDGSAATLQLERLSGTEAPGAGDDMFLTQINLKGTANTVQTKQGADIQNVTLATGDRLCLQTTGTLTSLQGVCVTISLIPARRGDYL